jgi:hypothetical protein
MFWLRPLVLLLDGQEVLECPHLGSWLTRRRDERDLPAVRMDRTRKNMWSPGPYSTAEPKNQVQAWVKKQREGTGITGL